MSVGDITSDACGSGARYNEGKVPYDLLPLYDLSDAGLLSGKPLPPLSVEECVAVLGYWQVGDSVATDVVAAIAGAGNIGYFAGAARVFDYGRKKYAAWNWAKGMPWSVPLGCALRHLQAEQSGELVDSESGQLHRDHAVCNAIMLLTYARTYTAGDDRPLKHLGHLPVTPDEYTYFSMGD